MNYVQGENKRKYTDKEVAEIICQAWNTLDASLFEPLLCEDYEYVSVWVLETMKGKELARSVYM